MHLPIRLEAPRLTYVTITGVAQSAPVRITAPGHGLPEGWRAAVMNVAGMSELNAAGNPPQYDEMFPVTRVDADTIEFNEINAAGFRPYLSGGQLVFFAPLDLSGFTQARMKVKNKVGGAELASFSTNDGTLTIDNANGCVWLHLTEAQTLALTFKRGVFDIELVDGAGEVTPVCSAESVFEMLPEVTT